MGALCGLMPLRAGANKNRQGLGTAGFVTCLICGLGLGCLLALPVAILFTLIIKMLPHATTTYPDMRTAEPFNPYAGGKTSAF